MSANACTLTDLSQGIKAVLFDLDGTLYLGNQLVDGVADVLNGLADHDLKPLYVTNNSSKSRKQLLQKLTGMGIRLELRQIYGAGYAAAVYAKEQGFRKIFCIGTQGLRDELEGVGIHACEDEQEAEALIIGMDPDFDDMKLAAAVKLLKRRCTAIACNKEIRYPGEHGKVLPGCGSIVAAVENASGNKIKRVVGKPSPHMLNLLCHDWNLKAQDILVVGDTYATDVIMAKRFGSKSILISRKKYKTTLVVDNVQKIREIFTSVKPVKLREGWNAVGASSGLALLGKNH
jgi:HAD superfamily hydrolase (TIGR01450 family)